MTMNPDPKTTRPAYMSSRVFRREDTPDDSTPYYFFQNMADKFITNWRLVAEIFAAFVLGLILLSVIALTASSENARERLSGRPWRRCFCCLATSIGYLIMSPLYVTCLLHLMLGVFYHFCVRLFRKDNNPRPCSNAWIHKMYATPFYWWDGVMVRLFAPRPAPRRSARGGRSSRRNRNRDEEDPPPRYTPRIELADMPPASTELAAMPPASTALADMPPAATLERATLAAAVRATWP